MQTNLVTIERDDESPQETEAERALRRIRTTARVAFERCALAPDYVVAIDALALVEEIAGEALK